ncbi:MAG: rhodanese-like domain-containing protein [Anaerobutyricum sp.]|nr:rhodanese-like domain-containing protein [Eubacterium sp.]MDY6045700.1 rhodanese-like domain-containing protein [Anaerobutyricum sp.]
MKKKYITGIIAVVLILVAGIFIYKRVHVELYTDENGQAVSIIGGADGPTSVFIAGKLGGTENMETYTSISMEEAKEAFAQEGSYIIVDVRRADEYAQGHIPGAINIANEEIIDDDPAELSDKDQLIYVYCRSGRRSQEAAAKLAALGYSNVIECGGIMDWTGEIEESK